MSKTPAVTQSKLNIAHNEVKQVHPNELEPHPKNTEIYGDTETVGDIDEKFTKSVKSKGVLEPLTVTTDGKIISGHRRWLAAKKANLSTVPIRREDFDNTLEEREAVIEFNRQREKTPGQIVNEFEEMLAIEKERAKERTKAKGNQHEGKETFPDHQTGQARDKAAEKVNAGVSGRTLEKGLKVKEKAKQGDETAQREWDKLERGETSFHKANRKVRKEKNKREREKKRKNQKERVKGDFFGEDAIEPQLYNASATELPFNDSTIDLIITSPPYNLGHGNWKMGGEGRETRDDGIGYQDDKEESEYQEWQLQVFKELYRVANDGASFFYNHKPRQSDGEVIHPMDWIRDDENPWTLRQEIVWDRESTHNHSPHIFWPIDERVYWMVKGEPNIPDDGTGMHSVWEFHGPKPDTDHPAPFPNELPRRCIEALGIDGDVVLDPFGGSMTTCEVAGKLGYESHGVDVDKSYIKQARDKWGSEHD